MAASIAAKMGAIAKVETILDRATRLNPDQPESWFDLAGVRSSMNKLPEAIAALSSCLDANARRLQLMPAATDLASNIQSDPRLASLRLTPEYRQLMDKTKKR
jgi:tetratricopeptide (TPR) repeat protein